MVEWEFFGIDICIECLQMLEICLRSCCEAFVTFAWCTCYLHRARRWLYLEDSWSSWFFFMVCGDDHLLRTNMVLGKGVVYSFIWHVILGVRMVSFIS